jgi:hypothetical protein
MQGNLSCESFNEFCVIVKSSIVIEQLFVFFDFFLRNQYDSDLILDRDPQGLNIGLLSRSDSVNKACNIAVSIRIDHS